MNYPLEEDYKLHSIAQIQQRAHEDRYNSFCFSSSKCKFRCYCIFDGHGGSLKMGPTHIADYCIENLHHRLVTGLVANYSDDVNINIKTIINIFAYFDIEMHKLYLESKLMYGTTCTMILIDVDKNKIYQVNLGDSKSIIFTGNTILSETKDHNPADEIEKARILESGTFILHDRIKGDLAVSRGFGDYGYKRIITETDNVFEPINGAVSCIPDIKVLDVVDDMYIILTSDAPYENPLLTSQALVDMFNTYYPKNNLDDTARAMTYNIAENSTDDTTIIIVKV
jgi:serine/threonine protein phosphatase PrpC